MAADYSLKSGEKKEGAGCSATKMSDIEGSIYFQIISCWFFVNLQSGSNRFYTGDE